MLGQKREPGDYCFVHGPNVYANFPGYVIYFMDYDDHDNTHNMKVPCYAYCVAHLEEVFSSAFFVTTKTTSLVKVLLLRTKSPVFSQGSHWKERGHPQDIAWI